MDAVVSAKDIDKLVVIHSRAVAYYNEGDYSNAIILYEDLLAEQETVYNKGDIRIGETLYRLGELYLLTNLPDIANYYFNEAIIISQNAFQNGKNALEVPLLNLLKIYTFQTDSIMIRNIEQQLRSISTIFQSPNSIYPDFMYEADTLYDIVNQLLIGEESIYSEISYYTMSNPRVLAHYALWTAKYYELLTSQQF